MKKSAITISKLSPAQIGAALGLSLVQLQEHGVETDAGKLREVMEKIVTDERHGFILVAASENNEIVGVAFGSSFLGLEHGGESGWLEELYVLPEWRQDGIGARLVKEAICFAQQRGCRALDLEIEANHLRVVSLYERHGFLPQPRSRFCLKLS